MDALVLNLETRAGLFLARSLGRAGHRIVAATWETSRDTPGMRTRYAAGHAAFPDPNGGVEKTAESLADYLRERRVDTVIPSTESALVVLHEHRDVLGRHTQLAVGSRSAVERSLSKPATLELARELGIRCPHTLRVDAESELDEAIREVGLPAVLKPERAWRRVGGRGEWVKGRVLFDSADVRHAGALVGPERPALVQEYVPGVREMQIRFRDRGQPRLRAALLVERMWPEIGVSVMRRTIVPPADTTANADALTAALDLDGFSTIEFRRGADGRSYLMEINSRPTVGPVEVMTRAGVDVPGMVLDWARGRPVSGRRSYTVGVRVGWLAADLRRLAAALRIKAAKPRPHLTRVVRDLAGDYLLCRAQIEGLDLADPAPLAGVAVDSMWALARLGSR